MFRWRTSFPGTDRTSRGTGGRGLCHERCIISSYISTTYLRTRSSYPTVVVDSKRNYTLDRFHDGAPGVRGVSVVTPVSVSLHTLEVSPLRRKVGSSTNTPSFNKENLWTNQKFHKVEETSTTVFTLTSLFERRTPPASLHYQMLPPLLWN